MALTSGTRLGPYKIVSPIGAGGMGEVYKANDTRLDRTVAIKVLPEHLAENPERKQRFEREAKAISQLNHPNICTLHDVGSEDGTDYLVMEYIEGESLEERLKKGALPLAKALECGAQVAAGLDKAHRAGIVHRDLKPGNVMLTPSGASLLDFGLARLASSGQESAAAVSSLPTEARSLTAEGSILGTFQYMAPEQLEGAEVDARTDIFAFGALLYEMVTGNKAFEGKSQASLISAIMSSEPPAPSTLQAMTPAALDAIVATCLAKDPEARWQSAADVGRQLKWIADGRAPSIDARARARRGLPERAALVAIGLVVGALVTWLASSPTPDARVTQRFTISVPESDPLRGNVRIAADGKTLIYVGFKDGARRLFHRPMDAFEATPVPGTENAAAIAISPDGEWAAGVFNGSWSKVSLSAGAHVALSDAWNSGQGTDWLPLPNDHLVGAGAGRLMMISTDGGEPETLTELGEGEQSFADPHALPNGRAVLFVVVKDGEPDIEAIVLETGERHFVIDGNSPRYAASGHLVSNAPNPCGRLASTKIVSRSVETPSPSSRT